MIEWTRHPKAEKLCLDTLRCYVEEFPELKKFSDSLKKTSTRLFDWVDYLVVTDVAPFVEVGYEKEGENVYCHMGAQLPSIVLGKDIGAAIKAEDIADFLMCANSDAKIEGELFSPFRRAKVAEGFWIVQREGTRSLETTLLPLPVASALEKWKARDRKEDPIPVAKELVKMIGTGPAAWVVLKGERQYWQSKNSAGQIQKNRQDRLGLGWANHDHHTFRSSRENFTRLVELFEILGFHCRERFYAGEEAGWGAQVMENSEAGLVLFLDVDLSPEEIAIDFAHEKLSPHEKLGTIGLWCALHGDSIHEASMHHLEAQFEFEELRSDLNALGIQMMSPFSDFSYLKQAFTKAEMWEVAPDRIEKLLASGQITKEQAETFQREGAVGSVMENLQRREGYKGFNQKNVSDIIRRTDPRA